MKTFFLLILISICFPQATSLPLYGAGELVGNQDVSTIGLGNGTFYSGNKYEISLSSPSSLWKTSYTRFSINSGINFLKIPSYSEQFQHNLTHFSVLFPLGNNNAFGFGLKPTYRTNTIEINQDFEFVGADVSTTSLPVACQKSYFLKGGISDFFLQYSFKYNSKFSFGLQYSFLFGNQTVEERRYTYDIQIDSLPPESNQIAIHEFFHDDELYYIYEEGSEITYLKNSNKYLGSRVILENKYVNNRHEFTFRAAIDGKLAIQKTDMQNTLDTVYYNNYDYKVNNKISELALGYHFRKMDDLGMVLESKIIFPLDLPENVALFNSSSPEERSFHFGFYKKVVNPKFSLWNNMNLRGGFYLKELNFYENKFSDFGFTLGFGIEYLANSQSFDIAFKSGKRESLIVNGKYENYFSIYLGIITGEKWFVKRRRK